MVGAKVLLAALALSAAAVDAFGFLSAQNFKLSRSAQATCAAFPKKSDYNSLSLRKSPTVSVSMKAAEGGLSQKYVADDGAKIEYDYLPGRTPTVLYLPGFNQTKYGSKAAALQTWCKRNKQGFFAADYYGSGGSTGEYKDGTITRWTRDTVALIDNVIKGPVLIVGSGVGGWIMLHVALQRPKAVRGLVGIAPTTDFTSDVVLPELDAETKRRIKETGMAEIVWGGTPYTISQKFIDDANNNLLLQSGSKSVKVTCPVRLLQGLADKEIPPNRALKISDALVSEDVVITYVKYGDHVLDEEEDFERMTADVSGLCSKIFDFDLSSPTSG